MNYYNEIKNKLLDTEIYSKVKDYSKERHRVITYYEIGKLLVEAGNKYGDEILSQYSKQLMIEVDQKYSKRTLRRIRQFYKINWSTMSTILSWSHYVELLSINNDAEMQYYLGITTKYNLSIRDLRNRINSREFYRLPNRNVLYANNSNPSIQDTINHPILIHNKNHYENISEKILQRMILEDIPSFMKELGERYSFIDSEYKIKIGNTYNYIDLLFFNIKFNCYVVIELKVTELKKEHIGQISTYISYIDKEIKSFYHDKTIGIILV